MRWRSRTLLASPEAEHGAAGFGLRGDAGIPKSISVAFATSTSANRSTGVDIVAISKRIGHSKPDITLRVYAHLFKKDDSKAAEAVNAALK